MRGNNRRGNKTRYKNKNCKRCREVNNKNKKKEQPAIKYEATPAGGFYKSETVLYIDNVKEEQAEDQAEGLETSTTTTGEEQTEEQPKEKP